MAAHSPMAGRAMSEKVEGHIEAAESKDSGHTMEMEGEGHAGGSGGVGESHFCMNGINNLPH